MEQSQRICKQCLIRESADQDFAKKMQSYLDAIEQENRCEQQEYARRLSICKKCEKLNSGICMVCGCYVELRAAVKNHYCADVTRKWDKVENM